MSMQRARACSSRLCARSSALYSKHRNFPRQQFIKPGPRLPTGQVLLTQQSITARRQTALHAAPPATALPNAADLDDDELGVQLELLRGTKPIDDALYLTGYLGLSVLTGVAGFIAHPILLKFTADLLAMNAAESSSDFETSFFGLLSIVYGLFTGQTFLFLYERQVSIVQELYGEVFALELLVSRTFACCQVTELRAKMACATRRYITDELYNPTDMESPFSQSSSFMGLLTLVEEMQRQGVEVRSLVSASQVLADAQSRRSAVSAQILPVVHWVFMHAMQLIFVGTFLLFDAAELFGEGSKTTHAPIAVVPGERSLLFGSLLSLLMLTDQVLHDLSNPFKGMYSFSAALDDRMAFLAKHLVKLETRPGTYMPRSVATMNSLHMLSGQVQVQEVDLPAEDRIPRPAPKRMGRRKRQLRLPQMSREVVLPQPTGTSTAVHSASRPLEHLDHTEQLRHEHTNGVSVGYPGHPHHPHQSHTTHD